MKTKVLFISHDAQPHGAQFLLLHLVRWIARHGGIEAHVLLKRPGPLAAQFAEVATTTVLPEGGPAALLETLRRESFDLVYSNTVVNGELLEGLSSLNCPVITHVHELEYWISYRSGAVNNAQVVARTDAFIACSHAVARCLESTLKIPPAKIFTVHEFIPANPGPINFLAARAKVRKSLQLPEDALLVAGSGTTDWRKSPDLFIQVARAVTQQMPNVHFLWVGGDGTGPEYGMLRHDLKRMNLLGQVHFLGHQENPREFFAASDLFALTSREDPYPLVTLEAAALGLPLLGFDQTGGIGELIEQDSGFLVPYLDISAMAARAVELLRDPALRRKLGERGREKVQARHDVSIAAAKIANIIEWVKLQHALSNTSLPKAA